VGCPLNSKFFLSHNIDWQTNNVGEVTDVEVNRKSLLQWLGEGEPVAGDTETVSEDADVGSTAARNSTSHAEVTQTRKRLKKFIEKKAKTKNPEEYTKANFLADARDEVNKNITKSMFNEVWRTADLPEEFKAPGRRPGRQ
jgi:hypothetical protein